RPYQALLDTARAKVSQTEAQLKFDEAEYQRYARLLPTRAVARAELEKVQASRDVTLANLEADRAQVRARALDLHYTKVTAPVSGRVGRYVVTVGNLLQAGEVGSTLLTTIVSVDPMYAYFDVDEHTVLRVKELIRQGKAAAPDAGDIPVWLGL